MMDSGVYSGSDGRNKREYEGQDDSIHGDKKARGSTNPMITLRLLIETKNAGSIIGKSGSNIKRLRKDYDANISIPDSNSSERVLSIHADKDTSLNVLLECIPMMEEYQSFTDLNFDAEINLLVHTSQAGALIGKGGTTINNIRDQSGAKIRIYPDTLPGSTDRIALIGGTPETIKNSLDLMYSVLDKSPIKGTVQNYDPYYGEYRHNPFDDIPPPKFGSSRGNFGGGRGGRGSRGFGGGSGPRSRGGRGGRGRGSSARGAFGGNFGSDFGGLGGYTNFDEDDDGFMENSSAMFGNNDGGGDGEPSSTQVTIPNDLAGAIIGKGGERIRQIRQRCGAEIKIAEPRPGSDDRIITITGEPDSISFAQYLLQQSVRMYSGKNL